MEANMSIMEISDRLFVILFFPSLFISLGVFFWGIGQVWSVSLRSKENKRTLREV